MITETHFLTYWRELNLQLTLLGKRPCTIGMARAAHRHCSAADAARYIPGSGRLDFSRFIGDQDMTGTLMFCSSRREAESLGCHVLYNQLGTAEARAELSAGRMVAASGGGAITTGWRAPPGTVVAMTGTFVRLYDAATVEQASTRALMPRNVG